MTKIDKDKCDGCGTCLAVCPKGAIIMPKTAVIIEQSCIDCKLCKKICPVAAIE